MYLHFSLNAMNATHSRGPILFGFHLSMPRWSFKETPYEVCERVLTKAHERWGWSKDHFWVLQEPLEHHISLFFVAHYTLRSQEQMDRWVARLIEDCGWSQQVVTHEFSTNSTVLWVGDKVPNRGEPLVLLWGTPRERPVKCLPWEDIPDALCPPLTRLLNILKKNKDKRRNNERGYSKRFAPY